MFDNIGGKIKDFAGVICLIGIGLSVVLGFIIILSYNVAIGIAIAGAGSLSSWVGSLLVYGFGELVDNSKKTAANSEEIKIYLRGATEKKMSEVKPQFSSPEKTEGKSEIFCPYCKKSIGSYLGKGSFCPWCGGQM